MQTKDQHLFYLDFLRFLAIFAVVLMHTSSRVCGTDFASLNWQLCSFFDSITRFAVPLLLMISGSLFLNFVFFLSLLLSFCLNKIKYLNKYIV
jgi:surface polysaccharide O-acyltransferase-like enzyme